MSGDEADRGARRTPRRDLGHWRGSYGRPTGLPFTFQAAADEFTVETLDFAAVLAEAAVQPFLSARLEPPFSGRSFVELRFRDPGTLASFRRTRSIRAAKHGRGWLLVRRWADAGGDGGLDEAMCRTVASRLNDEFENLLDASVVTLITRR